MAKRIRNLALSMYPVFNGMLGAVEAICRFSMMFDIYLRILTKSDQDASEIQSDEVKQ